MKLTDIWKMLAKTVNVLFLCAIFFWIVADAFGFPSSKDPNFVRWGVGLLIVYVISKELEE